MDIVCPPCGEPYDLDELHAVADVLDITFDEAWRLFRTKGCREVFDNPSCVPDDHYLERREVADLMGSDVDGYASACEDFGLAEL
jgi:hypothetical protein